MPFCAPKAGFTLTELAKATGLSPRVIRYNMDLVRAWMQSLKVEFVSRPGFGFEVLAAARKRRQPPLQP
jgi:transcriptional antiterminator